MIGDSTLLTVIFYTIAPPSGGRERRGRFHQNHKLERHESLLKKRRKKRSKKVKPFYAKESFFEIS